MKLLPNVARKAGVASLLAFVGLTGGATACKKPAAQDSLAAEDAANVKTYAESIFKDAEVGLRAAAPILATSSAEALSKDSLAAKEALLDARRRSETLRLLPASFFALVDASGRIVRSSLEVDNLATERFDPACAKATGDDVARVFASLPRNLGPSLLFCKAVPAAQSGVVAVGFNYVDLAFVLRNHLKEHYDGARDAGSYENKTPVFYAAIYDDTLIAWSPETPEIVRAATDKLGFRDKASAATFTVEVESRSYGVAKKELLSKNGSALNVAIVRSDI